jgi:catechol 2,3-dioxygenase-like lactoylglutathione lyase family enzyme
MKVRAQPLIAVADVVASSRWYSQLLGLRATSIEQARDPDGYVVVVASPDGSAPM